MKSKLRNILSQLGLSCIFTTDKLAAQDLLSETITAKEVRDARSAAFEAFGFIKMTDKPVAVVVNEDELASMLTAVTEAWFQRKDLILITMNGNFCRHFDYLDRCIVSNSLLFQNSNEDEIVHEMQLRHGPHLLRTTIVAKDDIPIDYSGILKELNNSLSDKDIVFCYNPTDLLGKHFRVISQQHRYCTISKYVGYLLGNKCKAVLCIPEKLLAYDSNIFNFRNLPNTFFVMVIADNSGVMSKLSPWIESNGIKVAQSEQADYSSLLCEEKPKIVYIK